jgi:hypothetical protein
MRRALLLFLLAGCGGDESRYPPGSLPTCQSYCERLATSNPSCGQEIEDCPAECELWGRDDADAGCSDFFDDVLYCTRDIAEVCSAVGNECEPAWKAWHNCLHPCDDVADVGGVTFTPECPASAPCDSGTQLTMTYQGPLPCTTMVQLSCAGGTTIGYLPASPDVSTGTIALECADPSGCGLYNQTTTYYSSGGSSVVSCTP